MKTKPLSDLASGRYVSFITTEMLGEADSLTIRQEAVPGFEQQAARDAGIFFCGAGGLTGHQAPPVVRKGYGRVALADMDSFEPSNYPRQFCYAANLYRNKGIEVARNLAREAVLPTELLGLGLPLNDAVAYLDSQRYRVWVINVDNNETRADAARHARDRDVPAIFAGVSADANSGYVFVQEPGQACWGCAFPHKARDLRHPCPNTPACVDILAAIGGLVVYAIDSLVMRRPRQWNLRHLFLDGSLPDGLRTVQRNPDCPLCS